MLRKRKFVLFLSTSLLGSQFLFNTAAFAQESDEALWLQLDTNRDGWLDGRELDTVGLRFDTDGDREVTKAEFLVGRLQDRSTPLPPAPVLAPPPAPMDVAPPPAFPSDTPSAPPSAPPSARPANSLAQRILTARPIQQAGQSSGAADAANTQPILGKMVQGKPVGFFYMQKYWIATRSLENSCWYFTPEGRVYQNVTVGFSEKDLAAHKGPQGTFEVRGSNLTVTWAGSAPSTASLELTDTGFYWDTGSYLPVESFSQKSLAGEYSGGSSSTFSGTSAMVAKTLRLNENGTFELKGVASFRTEVDSSSGTNSKPLAGGSSDIAGRWKQDGFYLTLTSDSGETQRQVIFPFDDEKTTVYPDRLYMSGIMYKKL